VIGHIDLEPGNSKFVPHIGCRGIEIAPDANAPGALRGDGPFICAIFHQNGKAARLAEHDSPSDCVRIYEAFDGLAVDDVWQFVRRCQFLPTYI
jgi:hypothetical protein